MLPIFFFIFIHLFIQSFTQQIFLVTYVLSTHLGEQVTDAGIPMSKREISCFRGDYDEEGWLNMTVP